MNLPNFLHPLGVVRWLYEPQSTIVYPELGFPHRVGRYRPVGSPVWSLVSWSCRDVEGFLVRGWDLILLGCSAPSTLARRATLAARRFHEPQPVSNQPVRFGFPHRGGRNRPEDLRLRPRVVEVVFGSSYDPGMGPYPPRVKRDLDVVPTGNSRHALIPRGIIGVVDVWLYF